MNLEFETLNPSQYVTDELEETWDITIRARGKSGRGYTPGGAAHIFDTNNPCRARNRVVVREKDGVAKNKRQTRTVILSTTS
jgi:hypothetical protein